MKIGNFGNRVFGDLGALEYFIWVRRVKLDAISREEIDFEHVSFYFFDKSGVDENK